MVEMIRKEMVSFVEGMNKEHRDLILEYVQNTPITISNRMTTCLGRVSSLRSTGKPVEFTFNKKYFEYGEKEEVIDTIHHEVIHILANVYSNAMVGHNETWKRFCRMYGVNDSRTANSDYMEKYKKANPTATANSNKTRTVNTPTSYKYHIICSECGKVVAKRNRLNKSLLLRYRPTCHRTANLVAKEIATGRIITL